MAQKVRADYVLDEISRSFQAIENECERLCLLINECLKEKYWKARYLSVEEFGRSTFGTHRAFKHLQRIASAFYGHEDLIGRLGRNKCKALIPVMKNEGDLSEKWLKIAESVASPELEKKVRAKYKQGATPRGEISWIQNRIKSLEKQLILCRQKVNEIPKEIESLKAKLMKLEVKQAA